MCFFNKIFNYQEEKFNTYKILKLKILGISFKIKLLNKINNNIDTKELLDFLYSSDNKDFVKITKYPYVKNEKDTKLIAFYLPQFHTIPLNDKYIEHVQNGQMLPKFNLSFLVIISLIYLLM